MNSINKNNKAIQAKVREEVREEYNQQINALKGRYDYFGNMDYFFDVLSMPFDIQGKNKRQDKSLAGLYCIQAPLELFDSFGYFPVRLGSGSFHVQRFASGTLPVLACPIIKSRTGAFYLQDSIEQSCDIIVLPTTCDWSIKIPQLIDIKDCKMHIMELPRVKESERARERWLEEIFELKEFIQKQSGRKFSIKMLIDSISKYMRAWSTFGELIESRRKGFLSGTWFIIIANAFMMDDPESWCSNVNSVLSSLSSQPVNTNPGVFLAGAPVLFPYLKITELIEEAGMNILADELCSSERIMESVVYDETTEYAMLKALADRSFLACKCPVYTDNDRRLNNILNTMHVNDIKGVIYHSLKGCHPYEADSFYFERRIKEEGFRFLKIETDFSKEDRQNILTRLEAFRETLG